MAKFPDDSDVAIPCPVSLSSWRVAVEIRSDAAESTFNLEDLLNGKGVGPLSRGGKATANKGPAKKAAAEKDGAGG